MIAVASQNPTDFTFPLIAAYDSLDSSQISDLSHVLPLVGRERC